jgi:hypothetical protein
MILLIPTAILLTISFFVLVTVAKVEAKNLKIFGWVICVFLWVVAALILATAIIAMAPTASSSYDCIGMCPLKGGQDWRTTPHHAWINNPHSKSMLDNPHQGMMMGSMDDMSMESGSDTTGNTMGGMMGGSDKKKKCPGMGDMGAMKDMPEKK